jgi:hypothetical protein
MKKSFDCVEMKSQLQEKLWIEAGESIEGLKILLKKRSQNNKLWNLLIERKEKQIATV